MKHLLILSLAACFAFGSCNNAPKEEEHEDQDTTVVIHEHEEAPAPEAQPKEDSKPQPKTEEKPEPPKEVVVDWRPLMAEYHEVLCRQHKGTQQPNDGIRQVELLKQLNDAREKLSKSERFEFTTGMARAANMASCN